MSYFPKEYYKKKSLSDGENTKDLPSQFLLPKSFETGFYRLALGLPSQTFVVPFDPESLTYLSFAKLILKPKNAKATSC